jgi:hypothetical protein
VIRALDQALSAPRVAIKTDQTARLRARMPDSANATRAEAYSSMKLEVPTRKHRVRRTTVQLLACGLTLSGVLAWADLHGTAPVRAEPALEVIAEPAASSATAADIVVGLRDTPYATVGMPVTVPPELVLARDVSFARGGLPPVTVVAAPSVVTVAPVVAVATNTPVVRPAPVASQSKRARPVRRAKARRVVRAVPQDTAVVDVVEQMLDAATAAPADASATEQPAPSAETVDVPGATPAAAVAVPSTELMPRDAYDEPAQAD